MKNSEGAKVVYEKALIQLGQILDGGRVEDKAYLTAVVTGLNLFTKLLNQEQKESNLRFSVGKKIEENVDELKKILGRTIPEYVG